MRLSFSFLLMLMVSICIRLSLCRRLNETNNYDEEYDEDEYYDRDYEGDYGYETRDNVPEDMASNRNEYKPDYHGYNEDSKLEESTNSVEKVLTTSATSDDEIKRAYKRYLKKLEQVKSQDDFDRVFNIKKSIGFKRQSIIYAQTTPCTPKDTTEEVQFTPSKPTEVIYPVCIPVKRCGGCCDDQKKECVAKTTQPKQTYVRKIDIMTGSSIHHLVDYVEDTTCECQCKRKQSDCPATQVLDLTNCKCECKTKADTNCGVRKQWSSYDCACVCSNHNPSCPTGFQWNKATCQCDAVYYPTCSSAMVLNKSTCTCN